MGPGPVFTEWEGLFSLFSGFLCRPVCLACSCFSGSVWCLRLRTSIFLEYYVSYFGVSGSVSWACLSHSLLHHGSLLQSVRAHVELTLSLTLCVPLSHQLLGSCLPLSVSFLPWLSWPLCKVYLAVSVGSSFSHWVECSLPTHAPCLPMPLDPLHPAEWQIKLCTPQQANWICTGPCTQTTVALLAHADECAKQQCPGPAERH